jgi:hypothetical protein
VKKRRGVEAVKNKLLRTNAPYRFYDPEQLETQEPRKDSFTVRLIERAWADVTTAELQQWIDLFTAEILRRGVAG